MIVTGFYAGLLGLWYLVLSFRVIQKRRQIHIGDGGDPEMVRRIRSHANFSEYVPLALILMATLENSGSALWIIHLLGLTLLLARLLHGVAMSFTEKWFLGRFLGTVLTFLVLLVASLLCIWQMLVPVILG
jgi:Uncharacterized relative of glutathione S-transferase, MAPEG superfamily